MPFENAWIAARRRPGRVTYAAITRLRSQVSQDVDSSPEVRPGAAGRASEFTSERRLLLQLPTINGGPPAMKAPRATAQGPSGTTRRSKPYS